METGTLVRLGVSLLLGLLVGLQRERTEPSVAGIRTFALIALFGTVCGLLAVALGGWPVAAGILALAILFVIGNYARLTAGDVHPGLTTELAALLMFGVGAYLAVGEMMAAVVLGGAIALLLQLKKRLHTFVAGIDEVNMHAIMQFVLVALVILPVLPNHAYGPYDTFNPFKIWLFVVLIVGMSLAGYILYQFFGERAGTVLSGTLGGLISSTATTVSFARQVGSATAGSGPAALVIMVASTILYVRVLVLIAAVATGEWLVLGLPLAVMFVACGLICLVAFRWTTQPSARLTPPANPAALRSALILGGLYAVISFAIAAAKARFGSTGLYTVAFISGLTDMDAITLSTAQLVHGGELAAATGWRAMLLGSLANLLFKAGVVAWLGSRLLLRQIALLFGLTLAVGAALMWLWPW